MTLKSYIWGLRTINLISLSALVLVIYLVDPQSGILAIGLFYVILFFALSGIFNAALLDIRRFFLGQERAMESVSLSFRQGILLSILANGLLILQSLRLLFWWGGLLVVLGVFLIELYFLSRVEK